jgi:hypothetical protein
MTEAANEPRPKPPRFSWPMRLFLGFLVFDIAFHSLAALTPYRVWMEEMGLKRFPKRLPTWEEISQLSEPAGEGKPDPLVGRVLDSFDSVWAHFKPWPSKELFGKLSSWDDRGMYALSWIASRLDFYESVVGAPQRWTMFSPSVAQSVTVPRLRLLFQDGTTQVIRMGADPEDLTRYSRWLQEKILDCESDLFSDYDARVGYCHYLTCKHPTNAAGSPLTKILIYKVRYHYPEPGEDPMEVLRPQNGPPDWDRNGPHWVYEVSTRRARRLEEEERLALQGQLGKR